MAENQNETVIELATDGRIEKADVETAMRQLDTALERGDTVHVFAEVRNFKGMSSEAWRSDLGNAFRYLARLRQFGRIAIVSDQAGSVTPPGSKTPCCPMSGISPIRPIVGSTPSRGFAVTSIARILKACGS
jgi:hypothetical protein